MTNMKILSSDAIQFLNQALALPATGNEQDWDIELADPDRINEFVSYYENQALSEDKRYALMALILASLEDLAYIKPIESMLWEKISGLITSDAELHRPLVEYWSLEDEDNSNDQFEITTLMRSLRV